MLTGQEVPSLTLPTDIGYLCQNVGTAVALYRFLQSGHPLTSRVTTVTGGGIASPRNMEVRLGTRVADLVAACGGYNAVVKRLIMGGSMMGIALGTDSVPISRATNCIIAATEAELRHDIDAMPCIRCGACSAVCPAYLLPQELHRAAERNQFDALNNLSLFDCIECGCCDVACPSHIQLTESFRTGKQGIVRAMDREARVRWIDARDQLRRQRIEGWEAEHGPGAGGAAKLPPLPQRLEAVADVVARVSRLSEPAET
jgi:electron transport complex protein RnfC